MIFAKKLKEKKSGVTDREIKIAMINVGPHYESYYTSLLIKIVLVNLMM
jgi:hypothetical protein